ncbi:MAG: tRNA lysidine(34) synthetase TilS [Planctomycetota bacterium]
MSLDEVAEHVARAMARDPEPWSRGVLAAVSGGADSLALLLALVRLAEAGRLPGPLCVGHVDHGAQSGSARAAAAVADWAARLRLPTAQRQLGPWRQRPSEAALRAGRYAALVDMARAGGARAIATAHHADDQIETVLFRLRRRAGPTGLAGIPAVRALDADVQVVRPLLDLRRAALRAAIRTAGLRPIDDASNRDLRYTRNRIRHALLPALRDRAPDIEATLLELQTAAAAAAATSRQRAAAFVAAHCAWPAPWRVELPLAAKLGAPPEPAGLLVATLRLLHQELRPGPPPRAPWLRRAVALARARTGSRAPGAVFVERTQRGLLLADAARVGAPPPNPQLLPVGGAGSQPFGATEWSVTAREVARGGAALPGADARWRACLDAGAGPQPWRLRAPRHGDRWIPLGRRNAPSAAPMRLRGALQAHGVPRFDRARLPLVVDAEDHILWVPGIAPSERARVGDATQSCIEVRVLGGASAETEPY